MSAGGAWDRDLLRVHALGPARTGRQGASGWERRYYPELARELTR